MDDAALVQRSAAGDRDAFAALYARYAARLYDFLVWVIQDTDEANQALYDTFLDAGSRVAELRDPSKARAWLFAIAAKRGRRAARRRHRHGEDAAFVPRSAEADAESPVSSAWGELVDVVLATATTLSPNERALLDLRFRQGLDGDELADAIGVRPEQVGMLVDHLVSRVEQTLAVTVVAYLGERDCPELRALLAGWDGRPLDGRHRDIVERHAQMCPTCGPRRQRHIPASALLGVSPVPTVPAGLAEHVLDDVDLAGHRGLRWSARRDGFPPMLLADDDRRRRLLVGVAAVGAVVLVGGAAFLLTQGPHRTERVASVGSTIPRRPATTTSVPLLTTVAPSSTTAAEAPAGDAPGAGGAGGGGGGTAASTGGSSTRSAGTGRSTSGPSPAGTDAPATEPPATDAPTTTTTPPPDTTPPSLGGVAVSPSVVRAGTSCSNGDPTTATVTVRASDPSGIAAITASVPVGSSSTVPMQPDGDGTYSATVGPFTSPVPAGTDLTVPVVVQATDASPHNNTTAATGNVTLRCRP